MCLRCGAWIPARGSYCPMCGALRPSLAEKQPQQWPPPTPYQQPYGQGYYIRPVKQPMQWRTITRTISAGLMLTFAVYLVLCLIVLVYGVGIVGPEIGGHSYTLYVALLGLVSLVTISGSLLHAWYLFLVGAILISATWLLLKSYRKFFNEITFKGKVRDHSPLFDLCALMFAVLFINTFIVIFLTATGNAPTSPVEDMEDWELLFILANASVWEEIIARVLLIGLPLMVVDLFRRRGLQPVQKYLLGGGMPIAWTQATLVVISAALFGFAHFEGWGSWKVFPAGVAGVAFGYMFLKHGLASAIMLHFSFDYLSMPLTLFDDSLSLQLMVGLGLLLWLGLGLGFTIYFTIRIAEFVTKQKYLDEAAPISSGAPGSQPPFTGQAYAQSPAHAQWHPTAGVGLGFFVCPSCGSGEARWHDGGLQCLRCGRRFH